MIEAKIKMVKQNKGQQLGIATLKDGDGAPKEEEIPPENLELRKEVRKKQRELNALRKKWWADRQDPKAMARKALQVNQGGEGEEGADEDADGAPPGETPAGQFEKMRSSIGGGQ